MVTFTVNPVIGFAEVGAVEEKENDDEDNRVIEELGIDIEEEADRNMTELDKDTEINEGEDSSFSDADYEYDYGEGKIDIRITPPEIDDVEKLEEEVSIDDIVNSIFKIVENSSSLNINKEDRKVRELKSILNLYEYPNQRQGKEFSDEFKEQHSQIASENKPESSFHAFIRLLGEQNDQNNFSFDAETYNTRSFWENFLGRRNNNLSKRSYGKTASLIQRRKGKNRLKRQARNACEPVLQSECILTPRTVCQNKCDSIPPFILFRLFTFNPQTCF